MRVNLDRGRGRSFDSIGVPIPGFNLYLRRFTLEWDEFLARIRYDKSATFRGKEKGTKVRITRNDRPFEGNEALRRLFKTRVDLKRDRV